MMRFMARVGTQIAIAMVAVAASAESAHAAWLDFWWWLR